MRIKTPYAAEVLSQFDTELGRLVDRLRGMPLRTLERCADQVYATCQELVQLQGLPHNVPRLADHAVADQLAVIGADCREMNEAAIAEATAALVTLRRALD